MNQPGVEVTSVCDVYEPHLERAVAATGNRAKAVKDFRAILADKSIDAVCVSTPDHWHPYIKKFMGREYRLPWKLKVRGDLSS